jgi:hypothetical protein
MLQVKASLDDHMDVLYYEVQMINRVFDEFSTSTQIGKNARFECFLLHIRNLIDFFFKPHPRSDDLNVSDFRALG